MSSESVSKKKLVFLQGVSSKQGLPCAGKKTAAEKLSKKRHYGIIDFSKLNAPSDPESSSNALITEISKAKQQKLVILSFPQTKEQGFAFERKAGEIQKILELKISEEESESRFKSKTLHEETSSDFDGFDTKTDFYLNQTKQALDFYNRMGVLNQIDGSLHPDIVYENVVKAIFPSLIFVYCPPACWATNMAKSLADLLGFTFLSMQSLANNFTSHEQHLNILIDHLENSSSFRFVIDSFFQSKRLFSVFLKEFCMPLKVIYMYLTKDQAVERILYGFGKSDCYDEKKEKFKEWLANRDEILSFLKTQPYFDSRPAYCGSGVLAQRVALSYAPQAYIVREQDVQLSATIVSHLENEKGYVSIDIESLVKDEKLRKTKEGVELEASNSSNLIFKAFRKVLFRNSSHKNFLVLKIANNLEQCILFEEECAPFKFFLDIVGSNFIYPKEVSGPSNDHSLFVDASCYYWAKGKLIKIDKDSPELLSLYLEPRNVYGFVVGFPSSGKTTISKHICSKFGGKWIDYEELTTKLKEKLGTPDEPLEELPFPDQIPHIAKLISENDPSSPFVFDGFPFELAELKKFVEKVGTPSFVLDLNVGGESLKAAYRRKNEMEPGAEIAEEEQEKLDSMIKTTETFSEFFKELSSSRPGINFFSVNANFSMSFLLHQADKIFQKRVFAVESSVNPSHPLIPEVFNMLAAFCLAKGIAFIDVGRLMVENVGEANEVSKKMLSEYKMINSDVAMLDYPGNYSPENVLTVLKNRINSSATQCRDILLYNYPCSFGLPLRTIQEKLFPRALDMLFHIESFLGPLRAFFLFTDSIIEPTEELPMIVWPPKEEPVVQEKPEGEEGEEDGKKEEAEDEEEGVVKFDPTLFSWTDSNGIPQDFVKVFHEHKRPLFEAESLNKSEMQTVGERFNAFLDEINQGSQDNLLRQYII